MLTPRELSVSLFRPDGKELATSGCDQQVKLWPLDRAGPARVLAGHTGTVNAVAFSADGRHLASAGLDGQVKIWDAADGHERRSLSVKELPLARGVVFVPGANWVAATLGNEKGDAGGLAVWDHETGKLVFPVRSAPSGLYGLAASPDGQLLASGARNGVVRLYDASTGKEKRWQGTVARCSRWPSIHRGGDSPSGARDGSGALVGREVWSCGDGHDLACHLGRCYCLQFRRRQDGHRRSLARHRVKSGCGRQPANQPGAAAESGP